MSEPVSVTVMATNNESKNGSFALCPEGEENSLVTMKLEWIRKQEELRKQLITHDDFSWHIPPCQKTTTEKSASSSSTSSLSSSSLSSSSLSSSSLSSSAVPSKCELKTCQYSSICYPYEEGQARSFESSFSATEQKLVDSNPMPLKTETGEEFSNFFQLIQSNLTQTEVIQDHLCSESSQKAPCSGDQCYKNLKQTHFLPSKPVNTVNFQNPEPVNTTVHPLTSPFPLDSTILVTDDNTPSKNVAIPQIVDVENLNNDHKTNSSFSNTCNNCIIRAIDYVIPSDSKTEIQYIGGVDISFDPEDQEMACAALIIVEFSTMKVVYEAYEWVQMTLPYTAGFLAFRECPVLLRLLEQLSKERPLLIPQVLMVDGNGLLHPRGFGLACQLGVLANIPTIGIGKNMHHIDGMTANGIRELASTLDIQSGEAISLIGSSGQTWGAALRSHKDCVKPIFVSIGHRISLLTAVTLVHRCCVFRIPEPVRQADKRSRERLNKKTVR